MHANHSLLMGRLYGTGGVGGRTLKPDFSEWEAAQLHGKSGCVMPHECGINSSLRTMCSSLLSKNIAFARICIAMPWSSAWFVSPPNMCHSHDANSGGLCTTDCQTKKRPTNILACLKFEDHLGFSGSSRFNSYPRGYSLAAPTKTEFSFIRDRKASLVMDEWCSMILRYKSVARIDRVIHSSSLIRRACRNNALGSYILYSRFS